MHSKESKKVKSTQNRDEKALCPWLAVMVLGQRCRCCRKPVPFHVTITCSFESLAPRWLDPKETSKVGGKLAGHRPVNHQARQRGKKKTDTQSGGENNSSGLEERHALRSRTRTTTPTIAQEVHVSCSAQGRPLRWQQCELAKTLKVRRRPVDSCLRESFLPDIYRPMRKQTSPKPTHFPAKRRNLTVAEARRALLNNSPLPRLTRWLACHGRAADLLRYVLTHFSRRGKCR